MKRGGGRSKGNISSIGDPPRRRLVEWWHIFRKMFSDWKRPTEFLRIFASRVKIWLKCFGIWKYISLDPTGFTILFSVYYWFINSSNLNFGTLTYNNFWLPVTWSISRKYEKYKFKSYCSIPMSYRKWNSKTNNGNSWLRDPLAGTNMKNFKV